MGHTMAAPPSLSEERSLWRQGVDLVAGVDEVGRGPLAGPVVAAAVILSPCSDFRWLFHVRDSKELNPSQREELAPYIRRRSSMAPPAASPSPPPPSSPKWRATATCRATIAGSPATGSPATRVTPPASTCRPCAAWARVRSTAAPSPRCATCWRRAAAYNCPCHDTRPPRSGPLRGARRRCSPRGGGG